MSWQNIQGYYVAAKSPHDAKVAELVWTLRDITQWLALALLPICAYTFMHHPDFASGAKEVQTVLNSISDKQLQSQLTVSVAPATDPSRGAFGDVRRCGTCCFCLNERYQSTLMGKYFYSRRCLAAT